MDDPFEHSVSYVAELPIEIQWLKELPDTNELVKINRSNELILMALIQIYEGIYETPDEHDEVLIELKRIERKINLLFNLLGKMSVAEANLPNTATVRINSEYLLLNDLPEIGNEKYASVDIYLSEEFPQAITILGECIEKRESQKNKLVLIKNIGMSNASVEMLDKIIFRHHRRLVAQKKLQDTA